jgi:hypothetical protein
MPLPRERHFFGGPRTSPLAAIPSGPAPAGAATNPQPGLALVPLDVCLAISDVVLRARNPRHASRRPQNPLAARIEEPRT